MSLRHLETLFSLAVMAVFVATAGASTLVHGQVRTCHDYADIDHALSISPGVFFRGWTSSDYDAARSWLESCTRTPADPVDTERLAQLANQRQAAEQSGDLARNDAALVRQRAAMKEQAAVEAAAQAQTPVPQHSPEAALVATETSHQVCMRSAAYERYIAQMHIVSGLQREFEAQKRLTRERRAGDGSGAVNPSVNYGAGQHIVSARDEVDEWWLVYKQSGGTEMRPTEVPQRPIDPCP